MSGLCWLRGRGVCLGGGVLRHGVGIFAVLWCCYLWSTPRAVVLEDDGLFILAAYFNGVAHPPGYPLYTLLGKWATLFPVGSVAFRVHALSGFFAALSGVCVGWLVWRYGALSWGYAWFAALALGFSPVFWSQAIVAEVYTLNVFFVLLLLCLCLRFVSVSVVEAVRMLPWLGVVYGLALSNHWPLLLLSTPGGLCVLWSRWRLFGLGFLRFLPGVLLGLLPYVWMVWRSWQGPVVSFYGPITSMQEFWFVVGRRGYAEVDHSASAGIVDKLRFVGFAFSECMRQFSWVGGVLVVLGAVRQWWLWPRGLCLGLSGVFLGCTVLLPVFLGFDYDLMRRLTFRVYPLPAWAVAALWLALGTRTLVEVLQKARVDQAMVARLSALLPVSLLGLFFISGVVKNYLARDEWGYRYASAILNALPEQAALFTWKEWDFGPLAYWHLIEGMRPDIDLYNLQGLVLNNRLVDPYIGDSIWPVLARFARDTDQAIYYLHDEAESPYGSHDYGLYRELRRDLPPRIHRAFQGESQVQYLAFLLRIEPYLLPSQILPYRLMMGYLCRAYTLSIPVLDWNRLQGQEHRVCDHYLGRLFLIDTALRAGYDDPIWFQNMFREAHAYRDQALHQADAAHYEDLRARYLDRQAPQTGPVHRPLGQTDEASPYPVNVLPRNPSAQSMSEP